MSHEAHEEDPETLMGELAEAWTGAALAAREARLQGAFAVSYAYDSLVSRLRARMEHIRTLIDAFSDAVPDNPNSYPMKVIIGQLTGALAAPPAGVGVEAEPWVIVAAHLSTEGVAYFWGPNFSGYTRQVDKAGRYTEKEAKSHDVWSERMEVAVPLAEAIAAARPHVPDDDAHAWFRRRFPGPKPAPAGTGGRR